MEEEETAAELAAAAGVSLLVEKRRRGVDAASAVDDRGSARAAMERMLRLMLLDRIAHRRMAADVACMLCV